MATLAGGAGLSSAEAGFLDFLFGTPKPVAPPAPVPMQQRPRTAAPKRPLQAASPAIGEQRTYCVRTCDGYYFAIGFVRNKAQLASHQAMCASSCGDAPMKLFTAPMDAGPDANKVSGPKPAIERAADETGTLYPAMPNAYAFRDAETAACACKSTASGLPQIPISIDPTLRNGDIVVSQDGLKVFRGGSNGPHQSEDFVSVAGAKDLPSVVRQQMLSLEGRIAQ